MGCIGSRAVGCWTMTRVSQRVECKCSVLGRAQWVLDDGAGDAIETGWGLGARRRAEGGGGGAARGWGSRVKSATGEKGRDVPGDGG